MTTTTPDKRPMEWNRYGNTDTAVISVNDGIRIAFHVSPMHARGYLGQAHLNGTYKTATVVSITADSREQCKRILLEDIKSVFSAIHSGLLGIGD